LRGPKAPRRSLAGALCAPLLDMKRFTIAASLALVTLAVTAYAVQQSGSTIAPERIFKSLELTDGMTVCEMGAGDGELTIAAAKVVGASGRVYTSELGDGRIQTLRERVGGSAPSQITVVAGDPARTNFPEGGCDALFMRNVYHHFADPAAINASIFASVKPGSRVSVVDFTPPGKEAERPADRGRDGMHGIASETLAAELKSAGFELVTSETGAQRWFMVVVARPKT
jgi:ubiquinone/menaquinone biosynthesis C-methylase UbiE